MNTDIVPYEAPKLLTEREVRVAGIVSNRRCEVRRALGTVRGATLIFRDKRGNALDLTLQVASDEADAVLAFLLERDEQFLTSLNIELEP
jgi:hypothetical protein